MKTLCLSCALITALVLANLKEAPPPPPPQPITLVAPQIDAALQEKWNWAQTQARKAGQEHYLLGYTLHCKLPEEVVIWGGFNLHFSNARMRAEGRTLRAALAEQGLKLPSASANDPSDHVLAIIWELGKDHKVLDVRSSDVRLPVSLENVPLYWAGDVNTSSSLALVIGQFKTDSSFDLKRALVAVSGLHADPATLPFLERVFKEERHVKVRAEALEALTWVEDERAETLLLETARVEPSIKLRSEAISALGELGSTKARDLFLKLLHTESNHRVRAEVVEALGGWDEPRVTEVLNRTLWNDESDDVREEALSALTQRQRNLDLLNQVIEKHPDLDLRGTAISLYVQDQSEKALPLVKRLLRNAPENLMCEAVSAVEAVPEEQAVPFLREVIAHHDNKEVRMAAISTLSRFPSPDVLKLLGNLVDTAGEDEREEALDVICDWPDDAGRKLLEQLLNKYKT